MRKLLSLAAAALLLTLAACTPAAPAEGGDTPPSVSASPSAPVSSAPTSARTDTPDEPLPGEIPYDAPVFEGTPLPFKELAFEELAKAMGAGINLGNTLDASSGGNGISPGAESETAWGNPKISPEQMKLIYDSGMRCVRIPITWNGHFVNKAPDYMIGEVWLDRVEEVVNYALDAGLYVIINMQHEDNSWRVPNKVKYKESTAIMTALWSQIAARFGGYGERLLFETMNEPRIVGDPKEWNGGNDDARLIVNYWNAESVKAMRATGGNNAKRWVLCPTYAASGDAASMDKFKLPDDPNTIVSLHGYKPYNFSQNPRSAVDTFDGTGEIDTYFKNIDDNFLSKGIPVILGEYGSINKDNLEERVKHTLYYAGEAAKRGLPLLWWDNGVVGKTSSGEAFGLMKRSVPEWAFPELVEALVGCYEQ